MNYGQPGAPETTLDTAVRVTTKHDGSLGIGWKYDGQYGIATRGSFTSPQATHATTKLLDGMIRDQLDWADLDDSTAVFEIIMPGNRIVLDYGDTDELLPLGWVDLHSGLIEARHMSVLADVHDSDLMTLEEALALQIPADEEGYVLDIINIVQKFSGERHDVVGHVKLKGEEYKILHGLLTNTNARRIWVQLAARECHMFVERPEDWANKVGHDPADFARVDVTKSIEETLLTNVPDEFYDWVTKQIDSMMDRATDLVAQTIYLAAQVNLIEDKRARYEWVKDHAMCKEILAIAASGDMSNIGPVVTKAWKLVKPAGNDTPFSQEED
jgi:RNA ligase